MDFININSWLENDYCTVQCLLPVIGVVVSCGVVYACGFKSLQEKPPTIQVFLNNDSKKKRVKKIKKSQNETTKAGNGVTSTVKKTSPAPIDNIQTEVPKKDKKSQAKDEKAKESDKTKNATKLIKNQLSKPKQQNKTNNNSEVVDTGDWQTCLSKKSIKKMKTDSTSSEKENKIVGLSNNKKNQKAMNKIPNPTGGLPVAIPTSSPLPNTIEIIHDNVSYIVNTVDSSIPAPLKENKEKNSIPQSKKESKIISDTVLVAEVADEWQTTSKKRKPRRD